MSVKIRLLRLGKKKRPFYRIVATDSRVQRDGKYLEKIGYYNPISKPAEVVIDKERAFKWLERGAIPTDTVRNFLSHKGYMLEWDLRKKGFDADKITEELKKWENLQLERQKRIEAEKAMLKRKEEAASKTKAKSEEPEEAKAEKAEEKASEES